MPADQSLGSLETLATVRRAAVFGPTRETQRTCPWTTPSR